MKRNINFGGMALLDAEGAIVEDGGLDIDQQHGDGADAALLEVQDTNAEVVANDAAVGELENTAMALESLLESAENSIETGGLDPLSAEILTKAVNNETAPLGTDAEEVVPALESFRSSTDRRQATVMAVESVKGWIEKVWAKIKELIAKGRDLAKKLYIKVKQAVQGLERRVAGLKKDLEGRNGAARKPGQVEFADGSWVVSKDDVSKLKDTVDATLGTYTDSAIKNAEDIAAALSAGDEKKAADTAGTDAEGEKAKAEAEKKKDFVVPTGLKQAVAKLPKAGTLLPGRRTIFGETLGFSVQVKELGAQVSKATESPKSLEELKAILEILETIAKDVTSFEKSFQKRDAAIEKVLAAGDKFSKEAKKAEQKDEGDVRAAVNAAKEAGILLDRPIRSVLSYSVTAINGLCGYVTAHLKMYDKK